MRNKKGIYEKYIKRCLDIAVSFTALFVLWPVLLIVALLVRTNLGSPVIFRQERPGKNEKIFSLYKFRTMTDAKDENGNLLPDAVRLTKFGKWLRSTSLDELPELWNILKGDMSIVGPRPLLVKYLPYYRSEERVRHNILPGLTGLAQVNGRNNLSWDDRLEKDIYYVNHITFALDLKILFLTVKKVLIHENVTSDGRYIMNDLDVERGKEYENH